MGLRINLCVASDILHLDQEIDSQPEPWSLEMFSLFTHRGDGGGNICTWHVGVRQLERYFCVEGLLAAPSPEPPERQCTGQEVGCVGARACL